MSFEKESGRSVNSGAAEGGKPVKIYSAKLHSSPVVALPGPGVFMAPDDAAARGFTGVMGEKAGHGLRCACLDCMNTFDADKDPSKLLAGGPCVVECPDCGAVGEVGLMGSYSLQANAVLQNNVYETMLPSERSCFADSNTRVTDRVLYRGIRVEGPPAGEGGLPDIRVDYISGYDQVTYDVEKQSIFHSVTKQDGEKVFPPQQSRVFGISVSEHMRNRMRGEWDGTLKPRIRFPGVWPGDCQKNVESADSDAFTAVYKHFCTDGLGFPAAGGSGGGVFAGSDNMRRMIMMAVQYPGVCDREVSKINGDIPYIEKRENRVVSEAERAAMRMSAVGRAADAICAMDGKLAQDLHKCKNGSQVESVLKTVTFGTQLGTVGKIQVPEDRDGYKGKFLQSEYNKNPYRAAANAFTCRKLSVYDVNHVKQLFRAGTDGKYPCGIVPPFETQSAVRFARQFSKTHNTTDMISQFYCGRSGTGILQDTLKMYNEQVKIGLCQTDEDAQSLRYISVQNQMKRVFTEGVTPREAALMPAFREAWGDRSVELVEMFYADWKVNPDEVHSGMQRCRNGKGLFPKRTLTEIHDELSSIGSREGPAELQDIPFPDEMKERLEGEYGGYRISAIPDTGVLFDVGSDLQICVYSGYRKSALSGQCRLMQITAPDGAIKGCIELNSSGTSVNQALGRRNSYLQPDQGGDAVKQWVADKELGCTKQGRENLDGIGTGGFRYGNMDHHRRDEIRPQARVDDAVMGYEEILQVRERLAAAASAKAEKEKASAGKINSARRQSENVRGAADRQNTGGYEF